MIEKALDRFNRYRPEGSPLVTMNDLAETITVRVGKELKESSVISTRAMFKRIDEGTQNSISLRVLDELVTFFGIDYNTLLSYRD
jgi:hypothetical protein